MFEGEFLPIEAVGLVIYNVSSSSNTPLQGIATLNIALPTLFSPCLNLETIVPDESTTSHTYLNCG